MNSTHQFFTVFPRGCKDLVTTRLQTLGHQVELATDTLVFTQATPLQFLQGLRQTPYASRMGLVLAEQALGEGEDSIQAIEQLVRNLRWSQFLTPGAIQIKVRASFGLGIDEQFTAKRVKRMIEENFDTAGSASVGSHVDTLAFAENDDLALITLQILEDKIWCGLDASLKPLHQRFGISRAAASLKENLAAAIVAYGPKADEIYHIIDPVCGAGTLLAEAVRHGLDWEIPLQTSTEQNLCLHRWLIEFKEPAENNLNVSKQSIESDNFRVYGYDVSKDALAAARHNFKAFPLAVHLERQDLATPWPLPKPSHKKPWVILNPPYGNRLGSEDNLIYLYECIGRQLQAYANRINGSFFYTIVSSSVELLDALHLPYDRQDRYFNGAEQVFARNGQVAVKAVNTRSPMTPVIFEEIYQAAANTPQAPDIIEELARRLFKNYKKIAQFIQSPQPNINKKLPLTMRTFLSENSTQNVHQNNNALRLYRIYDGDIPEYNCAVDIYEHCLYVQEYKAPASVPEDKAAQRLEEMVATLSAVFKVPKPRIAVRARQRQQGRQQYSRINPELKPINQWHKRKDVYLMQEWGAQFIINLGDYLNTGLFLDHRKMRWLIGQLAYGKHMLNLFAYTGAASVHAALGGAVTTTSIDLSPQYTAWARHNLIANGLSLEDHQVAAADVMQWLSNNRNQYNLIFIDPPTFSNSKKAEDFVVQDDHYELIRLAMKHLQPGGHLIFSCNLKRFELSPELHDLFTIQDISWWSQSPDFQRKTGHGVYGGHYAWVIEHK